MKAGQSFILLPGLNLYLCIATFRATDESLSLSIKREKEDFFNQGLADKSMNW